MPIITAATVGLCLKGMGTIILGVRTYLAHKDSIKTRKTIQDQVKSTIKGQDALFNELYNIEGALNRIERIGRDTIDSINKNSKLGDYKHIYIAFEFLEQANLCTKEEAALRYIDSAHQHFTEAFIGLGLRTDLTTDEKNHICQAKIGDAMCCYYLNDPANACKRLYESNLERPVLAPILSEYELIKRRDECSLNPVSMYLITVANIVVFRKTLGPRFFNVVKETNDAADEIAKQCYINEWGSLSEIRKKSIFLQIALQPR